MCNKLCSRTHISYLLLFIIIYYFLLLFIIYFIFIIIIFFFFIYFYYFFLFISFYSYYLLLLGRQTNRHSSLQNYETYFMCAQVSSQNQTENTYYLSGNIHISDSWSISCFWKKDDQYLISLISYYLPPPILMKFTKLNIYQQK